jgi:hypothetical protein
LDAGGFVILGEGCDVFTMDEKEMNKLGWKKENPSLIITPRDIY